MSSDNKPRFIRKGGRIIPIGGKKKRDNITKKEMATKASRLKPKPKNQKIGGAIGAGFGLIAGLRKKTSIAGVAALTAFGGLVGTGAGSIRVLTKKEMKKK